ncbi:hypothetical protein GCK72_017147 [Caenorhabditis remanei]|uniref:Uncharacterized protein n=1 Tax=Caenorhabditis remanei TaxID=31234 RepID=A0A6A5G6W9_CAERE|nr:hypothetical protein GCK72_017147 [Caenorhabditis remanei]KAF1750596.1 hypothetical protein GCK72_017147 [Caenorhabditis remanei]
MFDYHRLSVLDLQPLVPLDPKKMTPMRIKIDRLESSNDKLVKDWKRCKKEVGEKILDFWLLKIFMAVMLLYTCIVVTGEVYLWIKISLPLMQAAFVAEILIFLFPIVYLILRRRQVKAAIKAKNENIEQEGDISKVTFDSEKEGDEEYMMFYKQQLKEFNSVKLKEVKILEEEIRLLRKRNFLWKQCVAMWTLFTCFMATVEVYQCIEIRGMDEALRNSAFVVETIIFLFPIGYLYIRERQEKSKMTENNKEIENADEIKEVPFNLEEAENEEYLEFYKDQLKKFNSVKLKEVLILEEEIRLIDNCFLYFSDMYSS